MTQFFQTDFPLAFGVLTWSFLWAGLGLMAVPIIIHLLNRRRFKTVTWAAMEFLLRAMKKNRRRLKFEQWLILATRCLLVFLLGFAVARPLGCENSAMAQFGRHTALNVFVIDNSYSAAYEANHPGGAKTHLDEAKKVVRELLSRPTSGGESVVIITAAKPATAIIAKPQYDLEAARAAVSRIEQSYAATDMIGALQLALKIGREETNQPAKNLYILSDSTRSAWEGPANQALKQVGPELASVYKVNHTNLSAGKPQWNGAVLDVQPTDNLVTTRFQTQFKADVKGYGPGRDATLVWKLDDEPIDKAGGALKLSNSTPEQIASNIDFKTGGPHVLSVQLVDDDRLGVDNVRNRVIDVASELKVLIVEGKRGVSPLDGSGAFLATAFAPLRMMPDAKPGQSDSYISPELITDLELGNKVLGDYSAVALAGVGQISPSEADALQKFVRQGGTLMLFMGDAVTKENYNAMLLPRHLLPGPLVKLMSSGSNQQAFHFDFKPKSVLHPLLHIFANQENTGLDTIDIFRYWQLDVPRNSGVERVLDYVPATPKSAPDPAITVHTLGQGRVVFVSTTAKDEDWGYFNSRMAYLELMHELLSGTVRVGDYWMNLTVGDRLVIPASERMTSAPSLSDPAGKPIVVAPPDSEALSNPNDKDASWKGAYHTDPIARPGMYALSLGNRKLPIAVNVPAADEANVTTVNDDAITRALGDIPINFRSAEAPIVTDARSARDYGWWCLLALLMLLGFECFIAMKFSHHRE